MLLIGCTGGIGSGKSTFAAMLAARGAVVVDTDQLARDALAPGQPAERAVIERFGGAVLAPDGAIDRRALAAVVFADERERRVLESIVHPVVRAAVEEAVGARRGSDDVVVLDIPLLVERGGDPVYDLNGTIVVDVPEDLAVERLVRVRSMDEGDVRARIAAQASRADRLARADFVVVNTGTLVELEQMADRAWDWIGRRAAHEG